VITTWGGRLATAVILALFLVSAVGSAGAAPKKSKRWGQDYFPNTRLVTHEGKEVHFFDDLIEDKVVVINFIFTSCTDSCPLDTARLLKIQKILGDRVGKDIFMYSISIDPEVDTPEVLADYAKRFRIGPGWTFLTGNESEILYLRKKLGLYMAGLDEKTKDHNMSILIGNQRTGQWMRRSPMDSPYFIADQIGTWLTNWETPSEISNNSYADVQEFQVPSMGENLFRTRCETCHAIGEGTLRTVGGGEDVELQTRVGPDLIHIGKRRDRQWLARWLTNPAKMIEEKDPIVMQLYAEYGELIMPNLRLNDTEINALLEYMHAESVRVEQATAAAKSSAVEAQAQHVHGDHEH
jgi:protein SCO1/2